MKQIMPQITATEDKSKLSSPPPAAHVIYALENNCEVVSKLLQILESIRPSNKKEGSVLRLIMTTGKMTVKNFQIFLGMCLTSFVNIIQAALKTSFWIRLAGKRKTSVSPLLKRRTNSQNISFTSSPR